MSDEFYIDDTQDNGFEQHDGAGGSANDPYANSKGLAVASFVLSLVNIFCCCCSLSFILAPLAIIFSIVTLVQKRGGKGFAIAGLVISGIVLLAIIATELAFGEPAQDFTTFANNGAAYVEMYEETGEVPDEFTKYRDPKYDRYWESLGTEDFDDFYGRFVNWYKQNVLGNGSVYIGEPDGSTTPDDGEALVDL